MSRRKEPRKQDDDYIPTWTFANEKDFIDGLGTHTTRRWIKGRTIQEWYRMYIEDHKESTLPHHLYGVQYCKSMLENMQAYTGKNRGR